MNCRRYRLLLAWLSAAIPPALFAGEPQVFWASEPVRPDETVMLLGEDLQDVASVQIRRSGEDPATRLSVTPLQVTAQSLKFVLPASLKMGVFECELRGAGGTRTLVLNKPEAWWLQGDGGSTATPGGWLRVFGRSLSFGQQAQAKLRTADGSEVTVTAPAADGFSLSFALPDTLATGACRVTVCNGFGPTWSEAGRIEIKAADRWPGQIFNVMDFYGANAEKEILRAFGNFRQPADRTQAIEAALKRAAEHGGGVVYLPEGKHVFEGELKIPPRTILRGAGMGLTVLRIGRGGFALDGGSSERRLDDEFTNAPPHLISGGSFGLQDLSLYVPRHFKAGIAAGDHFRMERVRIRVDRYWIRAGQRENECMLRMGGDSSVADCDIVAQGVAVAYSGSGIRIARNRIQAGKQPLGLDRSDGAIVEDNEFISLDPTAYINLAGEGRNVYYARNRHGSEFVHQSDFSFTFDGQGGAYLGKVSAADGAAITLAVDPSYPEWAREGSSLWRRSVIAVLSGRGAGQYRHVVANQGRNWRVDRPFDVAPDASSTVSIIPFRGRLLVVGNRFEDANWVNMGYGSSFDVVCASNELYRVGALLNYGLRQASGVQPSWFVQYLDNAIHEGRTDVQNSGDLRNATLFGGTVTRGCVIRGAHLHADNSGDIQIGGNAQDVVVERCVLDNLRSRVSVEKEAAGVLLRNNTFSGGSARYAGDRLGAALVLPQAP